MDCLDCSLGLCRLYDNRHDWLYHVRHYDNLDSAMGQGYTMISDDIQVVQGSLGSGKSLVAVIEAIYQLRAGGVVASNFSFSPNWAWDLAGQDLKVMLGLKNRSAFARDLYSRCFKIGNPESMKELSGDRGSGLARLCTGKLKNAREGKGLLILDDCHHFFNSRTFAANKEYVTFFANARKYGWRTLLITHSIENIDKQIRSYVEIESRFRNLQKFRIPILGIPLSPIPCFLIVRRYAGLGPGSGSIHSKDLYFFDRGAARLYDTLERFGEDQLDTQYSYQGNYPAEIQTSPGRRTSPRPHLIGQSSPYPEYWPQLRGRSQEGHRPPSGGTP